jgi:hypothetical protein
MASVMPSSNTPFRLLPCRAAVTSVVTLSLAIATPALGSTFWKHVTGMKAESSSQVVDATRAADGDAATTARLTARPGQPAVMIIRFREGEILKGVSLHMGAMPKGGRCTVEFAWDERDWHRVWYLDGPHPSDVQGFGFNQWPAAQFLRVTFEVRGGTRELRWHLNEVEVYAEE